MRATEPSTTKLEPRECGHVLLFTGGDPIAQLVRWQSRSIYSHAALLIPGTLTVIESYPFHGVRKRQLTPKDWNNVHAFAVPEMTAKQWAGAIQFAESQLGAGYDWRNVFRFVSRIPARENQRWFCSELVFQAIAKTFLRVLNMAAEYVNPGHLADSTLLHRDESFELMIAHYFQDDEP